MESDRESRSMSGRRIDPVRIKVDILIKQKLDTKKKDAYRRKKRDALDMIAYYDYDGDEEQDMSEVNELKNKYDGFPIDDKAKIKRGEGVGVVNKIKQR